MQHRAHAHSTACSRPFAEAKHCLPCLNAARPVKCTQPVEKGCQLEERKMLDSTN